MEYLNDDKLDDKHDGCDNMMQYVWLNDSKDINAQCKWRRKPFLEEGDGGLSIFRLLI